jgi:hypothetical protein
MKNPARAEESRAERLERYANDRRFLQIVNAMVKSGVKTSLYVTDAAGVRHRMEGSTALPLCCAPIPKDAPVEFYKFTSCVWCVRLGG